MKQEFSFIPNELYNQFRLDGYTHEEAYIEAYYTKSKPIPAEFTFITNGKYNLLRRQGFTHEQAYVRSY